MAEERGQARQILVVEDEIRIAEILIDYLKQSGYNTQHLDAGDRVVQTVKEKAPDLILLDVMLPGKDGLTVCKEIRQFSELPIILVTAKVDELDRLLGLELGADDYICKPFSPREVVARVKAVLKRAKTQPSESTKEATVSIDEDTARATVAGKVLALTPTEFRLIAHMAKRPGRVFSRTQLLELCFPNGEEVFDRVIDSHIKNLRKKISDVLPDKELIHSVYGIGYRYEES